MMMMMTTIMPAESAYRLFQTETRSHRHRNQPGDGGMALFDIMSASFFFFFRLPFPFVFGVKPFRAGSGSDRAVVTGL